MPLVRNNKWAGDLLEVLKKQRLLRNVTSKASIEFLYVQTAHMRGTDGSSKQMDKKILEWSNEQIVTGGVDKAPISPESNQSTTSNYLFLLSQNTELQIIIPLYMLVRSSPLNKLKPRTSSLTLLQKHFLTSKERV